jgi:glucokinase
MILAADVGGTKTNLAFFEVREEGLVVVEQARYASRDFNSLDELALHFLSEHRLQAQHACFAAAGPCHQGICEATNLPWHIDARKLQAELKVESALVINDLEATAYAVDILPDNDFVVLQKGSASAAGNAAVIAAGTGLGQAGMFWDGTQLRPFASEGGHSDFAPRNSLEADLFVFLRERFGHVAWERVLSGPGLLNLYQFFFTRSPADASAKVAEEMKQGDPAAVISQAAVSEQCAICTEALDLFVSLYGAEAGNLALKVMATGGVYIGGGIAPRILPALKKGTFVKSFQDKGRLRQLLEKIPIRIITTNRAALLGAAHCARLQGGI